MIFCSMTFYQSGNLNKSRHSTSDHARNFNYMISRFSSCVDRSVDANISENCKVCHLSGWNVGIYRPVNTVPKPRSSSLWKPQTLIMSFFTYSCNFPQSSHITFLGRFLCWPKLSCHILQPLLQLLLLLSHLLIFWFSRKFLVWNTRPNLIIMNVAGTFQLHQHVQFSPSTSRNWILITFSP